MEIAPHDLGERLATAGFSPEDPVDEHGEFCVRGGVVDFYPASEAQPVRLEFIGDIVESIRRYDAATQRSLAALDQVAVTPQRELLTPMTQAGRSGRVRSIRDDSSTTCDAPARRSSSSSPTTSTSADGRSKSSGARARPTWKRAAARSRRTRTSRLAGTTSRPWLATGRVVTRARDRRRRRRMSQHVTCTPAVEYHGRIGDWVEEIRAGARPRRDRRVRRGDARAAPSARSSCSPTTRSARATSATPTTSRTRPCSSRPASCRADSTCPAAQLPLFAETDLFEEERRVHERRRSATRARSSPTSAI